MKKLVCLLLTLLLALFMMDYGLASSNTSTTTVQTSKVSWGILGDTLSQCDQGADQTCDPGLNNPRTISEGKDVGSTSLQLKDSSTLSVSVSNAYPSYYNKINVSIKNFGELAVKKHKAVINWQGKTEVLDEGVICYLHKNGGLSRGGNAPHDAVLELRWTGSGEDIQNPGEVMEGIIEFHVLPAAEQNHSYCFDVTLAAEAAEVADSIDSEEEEKTDSKDGKTEDVVEGIVDLPKTGGNTACYYLAGAAMLLIGAVVTLLRKK